MVMVRKLRGLVVVVVVLATPAPAMGQGTTGEFAASFTGAYQNAELFEYQPSGILVESSYFFNEWLGVTGEFGYATGSGDAIVVLPPFLVVPVEVSLDVITGLGGVRARFPNSSFVTPSARFVVGAGTARAAASVAGFGDTASDTFFTIAFGGAVDFSVSENLAIRVQPDFIFFDASGPVMSRFAFGLTYSFGREIAGRQPQRVTRAVPAGDPPAAVAPTPAADRQPVAVATPPPAPVTRIDAGQIPAGTAPPEKVAESARWTSLTGAGVGYQWNVTVRNNDIVPHTAGATATLYDQDGDALYVSSSETVAVAPGGTITLGGTGDVSRELAERGDYWTITIAWVGG